MLCWYHYQYRYRRWQLYHGRVTIGCTISLTQRSTDSHLEVSGSENDSIDPLTVNRKVKIGLLLCLGGLVIAFSLLRCILTVMNPVTVGQSSVWATREIVRYLPVNASTIMLTRTKFVATFAVNAPILNALFQKETWTGKKTKSGSYQYDSDRNNSQPPSYGNYHSSKSHDAKRMEIYKMTDIETSSKESTKELVDEREGNESSSWPPGAVAPMTGYQTQYPKGAII